MAKRKHRKEDEKEVKKLAEEQISETEKVEAEESKAEEATEVNEEPVEVKEEPNGDEQKEESEEVKESTEQTEEDSEDKVNLEESTKKKPKKGLFSLFRKKSVESEIEVEEKNSEEDETEEKDSEEDETEISEKSNENIKETQETKAEDKVSETDSESSEESTEEKPEESSSEDAPEQERKIKPLTVIIFILIAAILAVLVKNVFTNEYAELRNAVQALEDTDTYLIFNTVSDGEVVYSYLDSKVGGEFYSEDEDTENEGYYYLSTWTRKDGTTYSYGSVSEDSDIVWNKYPSSSKKLYNSAKVLDITMYMADMQDIEYSGKEYIDLGLESDVEVDVYTFTLDSDAANKFFNTKSTCVYEGILSYFKSNNSKGKYDEAIESYESYIEEQKKIMNFGGVDGKFGIYDGKLVMTYLEAYGGGSTLQYSKVVGFDEFTKRETPDFENEGVAELAETILKIYYDNLNAVNIDPTVGTTSVESSEDSSTEVENTTEKENTTVSSSTEGSTDTSESSEDTESETTEKETVTTESKTKEEETTTEKTTEKASTTERK